MNTRYSPTGKVTDFPTAGLRPENLDSGGGYRFLPQKLNKSEVKIQSISSLWVLGTYRPVYLTLQSSRLDFEIETLFLHGYLNIFPKLVFANQVWQTVNVTENESGSHSFFLYYGVDLWSSDFTTRKCKVFEFKKILMIMWLTLRRTSVLKIWALACYDTVH